MKAKRWWCLVAAACLPVVACLGAPASGTPATTGHAVAGQRPARAASGFQGAPQLGATQDAAGPVKAAAQVLTADDARAWLSGFMGYALEHAGIAGAAVSIVKDGHLLLAEGFGFSDVKAATPMSADTLMRIGSTSKLLTWTAVMQLMEAGKLDLHRNVDSYLDFKVSPSAGPAITLLDLMNHRGGFEEGIKDILTTDPKSLQSLGTYVKTHRPPQLFASGEVPAYSNYGAALAGYIVERVSGKPFARYVKEHILDPLRMDNSSFEQPLDKVLGRRVSQGYRTSDAEPQAYELVTPAPAGAATASASDMARFMIAQLEDGAVDGAQILKPQTLELMHTPSSPGNDLQGFASLAHGFFYERINGHTVLGHGGDTIVFHTDLTLLLDQHVGIFVSFNSRGREDAVYGVRENLRRQFFARYFPSSPNVTSPPPAIASAHSDAARLAGRYESSRRIERSWPAMFYLLQQLHVIANHDGTLTVPSLLGAEGHFVERMAGVWQEVDVLPGHTPRQLRVKSIGGRGALITSDDPVGIFQAVPAWRSTPVVLSTLTVSFLILVLAVLLWPVSWALKRYYKVGASESRRRSVISARAAAGPAGVSTMVAAELSRRRTGWLVLRLIALFELLWLTGWFTLMKPVLSTDLVIYNASLDGVLRVLQVGGIFATAAALGALYVLGGMGLLRERWPARLSACAVAAASVGVVAVGTLGGLMIFELNY